MRARRLTRRRQRGRAGIQKRADATLRGKRHDHDIREYMESKIDPLKASGDGSVKEPDDESGHGNANGHVNAVRQVNLGRVHHRNMRLDDAIEDNFRHLNATRSMRVPLGESRVFSESHFRSSKLPAPCLWP